MAQNRKHIPNLWIPEYIKNKYLAAENELKGNYDFDITQKNLL